MNRFAHPHACERWVDLVRRAGREDAMPVMIVRMCYDGNHGKKEAPVFATLTPRVSELSVHWPGQQSERRAITLLR